MLSPQSTTDTASAAVSADPVCAEDPGIDGLGGIDTLGLWDFEVNGRILTDEFIEQTSGYVILRRYGTNQNRRYEKIAENEYRNARGSVFRFVTDTRALWISPDKTTVYQLKRQ